MKKTLPYFLNLIFICFTCWNAAGQTITTPVDNDGNANYVIANATSGTDVNITALSTASGFSTTNRAQGKTVTVSSIEQAGYPGADAVDGNTTSTRWSSQFNDNEWLVVDLGASYDISEIKLYWEAAYGKTYLLQVSDDNSSWTTVKNVTNGNGGTDDYTGLTASGRYVRMYGLTRGTQYGFSLYEFQVYGVPSVVYSLTTNPSSIFQVDASTGDVSVLSGTSLSAGTYIIRVKATASTVNASANFTVIAVAAPTVPNVTTCSPGTVTLTASESVAGGTYKWYAAPTGGSPLQSSTSATYSPTISATTNYYVSYTIGTFLTGRTMVTATVGSVPVLSAAPTGSGLYLSYPFSGNADDASTPGTNDGTVQGAAPLTTDRYNASNKAYSFNGSSQYITSATAIPAPGPQNFSISVWFKTSVAGGLLAGYGSTQTGASPSYDRHIYMTNAGQIYYGIYPNAIKTIGTASSYADGNWHHVVATTSTTAGSFLFIDGAVVAADATMTTAYAYTTTGYWRVGYNNLSSWTNAPTNLYFNGQLDDVAIYNTAIPASTVYTLYGAGSPPTCVGSPLLLQANSVAGATYAWSGPGGYSSSSQNATVTSTATTAKAGTYTLTVTSASGCTTTTTVTAVVNTLPVATFTATTPVTTTSNSTVTYTGTYVSTSTYTWNFGGGTVVSGSGVGPYTINWATAGTKTVTLTVTNAAGCSDASTQNVVVALGNYGNYGFKKAVTLNTTTLGITSDLTNFPALLSIQDDNLKIASSCADKIYTPNGPNYDFAFVDATGTELYYQVESYNQTAGTLLVWVQIPTLTYAANNAITFFYGSISPSVTHDAAFFQKTWASDYQAVFHFNEAAYTGSVTDGTAGAHTGTAAGMTSADLVTGKIGMAYSFNGSSKKITSNAVNITGSFTISAWVQPTSVGVDQKIITNQASGGSTTGGYKLGVYNNNIPETESATAIDRGSTPTAPAFAANVWHYVQGVFNGTTLSTYVDGVAYANFSTTIAPSSTTPLYIGVGEGGGSYYFNGIIDEARVSNVAKSSDWLKAEYVNQGNPISFTTSGATTVISANAAAVPGALTYTWKGTAGTDPTNANNWNNTTAGTTNQLPAFDGTATLIIPTGLTNYPSLTANASLFGLTIASGASFNLNGHTLSVACNIYNSSGGQILYGTNNMSSITWNGTLANQTYTGTNTSNTASLGSMTINNTAGGTVTITSGPVDIYKSLTITQGNLAVGASPAALTLKSTATQTAYVAPVPTGSTITGTVKVERYLTGGAGYRGYRLISSPVYAATVNSNNVYDINYLTGGMFLTGDAGGGFDKTGNPSLYLFREDLTPSNASFTSGNFQGISKINNTPPYNYYINSGSTNYNVPIGNGVMVFFRGNRASASLATETSPTYTTPVAVTLTSAGTLNVGPVTVHDWYTPSSPYLAYTGSGTGTNFKVRGFNLVGNPYASSIDWETYNTSSTTTGIYTVNVGTTIWEWNPATKNYDTYQKGGARTNHGSNVIASGQGFYVQANNVITTSSPQLIFNESAKTTAQNTALDLFMSTRGNLAGTRLNNSTTDTHMRLQLAMDSVNTDDIYIGLNTSAKRGYVFDEDAEYKSGTGAVSLASISADNVLLAINRLSFPKQCDTIKLKISATAAGLYHLNMIELQDIPDMYEVWLMDAYKKDSLDIKHNPAYAFDLFASDTASYGSKRFSLIIRQNPAMALHLLNFTGAKTDKGAQINWTTENEENYTNFTVERSSDGGKTYVVVGGYASSSEGTYSLLDKSPPVATDWYRLKLEDLNGAVTYSKPIQVMYSNLSNNLPGNAVTVYPNPATNTINVAITPSILQLQNTSTNGSFAITITGSNGVVVKKAVSTQPDWQGAVGNLLPGSYVVQVVNKHDQTVVGKSKFVKL